MTTPTCKFILIEPSPVIQHGLKIQLEESHAFKLIQAFSDLKSFEDHSIYPDVQLILINPALIRFHKQLVVKNLFTEYPQAIIVGVVYTYLDAETVNALDGVLDIYDDSVKMTRKLSKLVDPMLQRKSHTNTDTVELSDREKEILIAVAKGLTNKEIAEKHFISIHTVISHRKNISRKTGIKTVSGLTIYAIFNNLISEEDL